MKGRLGSEMGSVELTPKKKRNNINNHINDIETLAVMLGICVDKAFNNTTMKTLVGSDCWDK